MIGLQGRMIVYAALSIALDGVQAPVATWHPCASRGGRRKENKDNAALDEAAAVAAYGNSVSGEIFEAADDDVVRVVPGAHHELQGRAGRSRCLHLLLR